jgi:hypothetical protein
VRLRYLVPEIGFSLTVSSAAHALTQPGRLALRRAGQKFTNLFAVALALGYGREQQILVCLSNTRFVVGGKLFRGACLRRYHWLGHS